MFVVGCGGSGGQWGRAVRVMLATLGLLAAVAIWSLTPSRADARYPVLLVHGGFLGSPANFSRMIERLRADHYDPYTVDLGLLGNDTAANAKKISARIDEVLAATGAAKVHLVGHSMGGLSARYYIKVLGGLPHVASYTAFGTPQHGNVHGCPLVADQCPNGEFLQRLNRGDDTPGSIRYTSIASKQELDEADGTLTRLDHGACLPLVDGGPHGDEPNNLVIYQAVKDGLNSTCPSGVTDLADISP